MTRQLCKICAFPTDSARDITHYRTCVRRKDWPSWVRTGGPVTAVAEATPARDGGEPLPLPPLDPLPEEVPEPEAVHVPAGATLAFGRDEESGAVVTGLLCDCGYLGKDNRSLMAHRRAARIHREAAVANA